MDTLDDALAFWKDALKQWWALMNDPNASEIQRKAAEAYYKRASEYLNQMKGESK